MDLSLHEAALPALLESMKFEELAADQVKNVGDELAGNINGRIMTIVPAGVSASRQIDAAVHSAQGSPAIGHHVAHRYRYIQVQRVHCTLDHFTKDPFMDLGYVRHFKLLKGM